MEDFEKEIERVRQSFIRAGEQCGDARVMRRLAKEVVGLRLFVDWGRQLLDTYEVFCKEDDQVIDDLRETIERLCCQLEILGPMAGTLQPTKDAIARMVSEARSK